MNTRVSLSLAVTIGWVAAGAVRGGELTESVRRDTTWLAGHDSRTPGTVGHDQASDGLLERVRAVPGVQTWVHEFPVVVPTVRRATIELAGGALAGTHAVYPVWPDLVRVKTTPEEGLSGDLIYVGGASHAEMPARSLRGNIAVMEMSAYQNWKHPFAMGCKAVLLLGGKDDVALESEYQRLYMPRYYVPQGPLADALRQGGVGRGTLHCDGEWREVTARNIYALLRPEAVDPALPPIAVAAAYDSMSVVMGLAPGADRAVDAAFALNALRAFAPEPPRRPVLFCFVDADGINQLGVRQMLAMLAVTPENTIRKRYQKVDADILASYTELHETATQLGQGAEAVGQLHDKGTYREVRGYFKNVVGPSILKLRDQCGMLRLAIDDADPDDTARVEALQAELKTKDTRQRLLTRTVTQVFTDDPISESVMPTAIDTWQRATAGIAAQLAEQKARLTFFDTHDRIRHEILTAMGAEGAEGAGGRLAPFVFGVDLSDAGTTLGALVTCKHLHTSLTKPARPFTQWMRTVMAEEQAAAWDSMVLPGAASGASSPAVSTAALVARTVNVDLATGRGELDSYLFGRRAALLAPVASLGPLGVTWTTLGGLASRTDTPQDTAARLDWSRLDPQVETTYLLLARLLNDQTFAPTYTPRARDVSGWRFGRGLIVEESVAETVARTPIPGCLVTLAPASRKAEDTDATGVRRSEFVRTGADGSFRFPLLPATVGPRMKNLKVQGFVLDERGGVIRGISDRRSMIAGLDASIVELNAKPEVKARLESFECMELDGPEFFDPRFLEPLNEASFMDVTRGGPPKRFQFSLVDGQMSALVEAGTRWNMVLRAGQTANRMVLLGLDQYLNETGRTLREGLRSGGFEAGEALPSTAIHISAMDLYSIDAYRQAAFRRAGIENQAIDALHNRTGDSLAEAEEALSDNDGATFHRAATTALASEIRAYTALRALGDDVIRGAIFLLLLLAPFAVAMERLVFAFPKIGHRIVGSVLIFALMSAILWSFHPAFRITVQPAVIMMAFSILLLSLLVIIMIMKKFEKDLEALRSGRAEASGAQTTRGGVLGSAVWLGIANMRKRKVRTVLTGTTIALVTFVLLCFSSTSYYRDKRQMTLRGVESPYAGVLVHLPGMKTLSPRAAATVENLLGDGGNVAARWWLTSATSGWQVPMRNPATGQPHGVRGALGLTGHESGLAVPHDFLPNWEQFAMGAGCYISERAAVALAVEPGETIDVCGRDMKLLGVFDGRQADKNLRMLNGQSLLPNDLSVLSDAMQSQGDMEQSYASGGGMDVDRNVTALAGDDVVLLPASFVKSLGGTLRSLAIGTGSAEAAEATAFSMLKVLSFPIYYGAAKNVQVAVTIPLVPKPPRSLLIPMIIAALIIFNTMLSSVAERKGEIHIYTSLGLAPRHVGVLFLAEAVTYGLMGSIFGYVVGQGVAKILTHFDLMGGITLNYSGSSVIVTMGVVMVVVVLSAIAPALMASRLATPSKDMKWRVPEPEDDVIRDMLPFTVSLAAAGGLNAFIHEFMAAHKDGSTGNFTTDALTLLPSTDALVAGQSATVWIAPYDLGVRQSVRIEIRAAEEDLCDIHIELGRESGKPRNWWRLNRTFLGDMRKQLLGWRNVKPEMVREFLRMASEWDQKEQT
ncbi:MAG: FtsX-like permease family protein [Verrucomicrobia bacterium]|nr:FtsX-like permease family protein [Verrucomicrobiota bacterium]